MNFIVWFTAVIISLTLHEFAHGFVAKLQGDDTAEEAGRLTLNPMAHIDIVGTIILPLFLLVSTGGRFAFGWAKPVPVNPNNFRKYRQGEFLVSSAGIVVNFIMAFFALLALKFLSVYSLVPPENLLWQFLLSLLFVNTALGVFNLLPLPPLDGAGILFSVLPETPAINQLRNFLQQNGFLLLLGIIILDSFVPIFRTLIQIVLTGLTILVGFI